jgi:hypothetical protein
VLSEWPDKSTHTLINEKVQDNMVGLFTITYVPTNIHGVITDHITKTITFDLNKIQNT